MPTPPVSIRIDPDLRQRAEARGRDLGLRTFKDCVEAGLVLLLDGDAVPETAAAAARIRELEAELERTRAQLAKAASGLAGRKVTIQPGQDPVAAAREAQFVRALAGATPENPGRPSVVARRTGFDLTTVFRRLKALTEAGYLVHDGNIYYPAEGADMEEGMRVIRGRLQAPSRRAREAPDGDAAAAVPEAPRKPSAARTELPAARSAAVARVRERAAAVGAPISYASELAATPVASVFRAGPAVDCLHENLRGVKGVCPDCKQSVVRKS